MLWRRAALCAASSPKALLPLLRLLSQMINEAAAALENMTTQRRRR
jgi:threonine/homoserine/homoserine lactone efflux protein